MLESEDQSLNIVSNRDQLVQILKILGEQDENDTSFITEANVQEYYQSLIIKKPKKDLSVLFPETPDALLKILEGLLQFNPTFRLTAKEALEDPIFDSFRNK